MLSFYFDCIDQFCDRSDFQLCELDTDSLYMAVSADGLDNIIKPEFKNVHFNQLQHSCQDTVKIEQGKIFSIFYVYFKAFRIAASSGYSDSYKVVLHNIYLVVALFVVTL